MRSNSQHIPNFKWTKFIVAAVLCGSAVFSRGASVSWTGGGGDNNWTTAANWVGGTAPNPGDDLDFPVSAWHVPNNDFPVDTAFASITFGAGYSSYVLSGNRIVVTGAVSSTADGVQRINLDMVLTGASTFTVSSGDLIVLSVISGAGGITKVGAGALQLSGANTYVGNTLINAGTLRVIGSTHAASAVTVGAGATLEGTGTVAGAVTVSNGGTVSPGNSAPLTVSIVSADMRGVYEDDWRASRTISGTYSESTIAHGMAFGSPAQRAAYGLGNNDGDWEHFAAQWDGYLVVTTPGTTLYTRSDDGSRVWLDLNNDGVVDASEWGSNGWGGGQGETTRPVHSSLAAGIYRMRIQYEEGNGQNAMYLQWDDAAHSAGVYAGLHIVPGSSLRGGIGTLNTGALTLNSSSVYPIDVDGTGPSFDQINSTGAVACAGTLSFGNVLNSAVGKVYTVVNAASVTGTFSGYPDGMVIVQQGRTFQIAYSATQVTLTDIPRPTLVWVGSGTDNNWSTSANWDVNLAPLAGDTLQFGGTTRLAPNNDLAADTAFNSITFNSGAGAFVIGGNRIVLNGALTNNDDSLQTINCAIVVNSTRTLDTATGDLTINGVVSGAGGITKAGTQTLLLSAKNTFAGTTTISAGTLQIGNGSTDGGLLSNIVNNAALNWNAVGTAFYSHVISGAGTITKTGAGELEFAGTSTYSGAATIQAGVLKVNGSIGAGSTITVKNSATLCGFGAVGAVTVENGGTISPGDPQQLIASYIPSSLLGVTQDDWRATQNVTGRRQEPIIFQPNAAFGTGAERAAFGIQGSDSNWDTFSVQWDGYLRVATAGTTLYTRSDDGSRVWLDLNGDGVVDASEWGSNAWGQSQPAATRAVHSNLPAGLYRMRVQFDEGGGGNEITLLWNDGANSAGTYDNLSIVPANLMASSIDTLTTGAVTFNSSANFSVELEGSVTSSDRINSGAVSCGGTLTIIGAYNAAVGKTYTIVNGASVSGTFSALPDGAMFSQQGRTFQIAYTATQVTLTDVARPTTRVWDGGGTDNKWTTAANWDYDLAPTAGDDLQFAGTTRLAPQNDFNATSFNSIAFNVGSGNFVVGGNALSLTGGASALASNATSGTMTLNTNITFSTAAPTLSTAAGAALVMGGDINNSGMTITVANAGAATLSGAISGVGGLTKTGAALLTLAGANTYSGTTTVNCGVLAAGVVSVTDTSGAFGNNSPVVLANVAGVALDITGFNTQIGSLSGGGAVGGNVTLGAATLTVSHTGTPAPFVGVISGTGNLAKRNAGLLTLSAVQTYGGSTTIQDGTIRIGLTGSMNPVTIDNSGFEVPNVGGFAYNPGGATWAFQGAGFDRDTGTWYSNTSGHEGVQGCFIQENGWISQTINVGTAGAYQITFQAIGRNGLGPNGLFVKLDGVTVASFNESEFSSALWQNYAASAVLTAGPHTLMFAGHDTFGADKSTVIDDIQMFQPANAGALPSTTALALTGAAATLELSGITQTIGSLSGVSGSKILSGNMITNGNNGSTTFAGVFSGNGALTKTGSGTLTLTGANSYAGGTGVTAGTLQIGDGTVNGTFGSGAYTIAAAARLYLNYATATAVSWPSISGAGTLQLNSAQAIDGSANWTPGSHLTLPPDFTGTLHIQRGRCTGTPTELGGTTALVVKDGAQFLAFDGTGNGASYTYPQIISLEGMGWGEVNFNYGALRTAGMNAAFTGAVTLAADTAFFTQTFPDCSMTVSGVISGTGNLEINDYAQGITLNGANTYTGSTALAKGTLTINSIKNVSGGASALGAPTTAGAGLISLGNGSNNCTLIYTGSGDTSDRVLNLSGSTGDITIEQSGSGLLKFTSAMIATGAGAKTFTLQGSTAGSGEIGAIVDSSAITRLTKIGTGTWTLSGVNTYTGPTTVSGGGFFVNGSTTSDCTVAAAATVGGNGTINGNLDSLGTIAPGPALNAVGILRVNGNLTASNSIVFAVNAPASTPGTHYDQMIVNGTVDLTGATLTFSGANGVVGQNQVVTLLQNSSAGTTTAASAPRQGSYLSIGNNRFVLNYTAIDGNDIVLTAYHARRTSQFLDFFP